MHDTALNQVHGTLKEKPLWGPQRCKAVAAYVCLSDVLHGASIDYRGYSLCQLFHYYTHVR